MLRRSAASRLNVGTANEGVPINMTRICVRYHRLLHSVKATVLSRLPPCNPCFRLGYRFGSTTKTLISPDSYITRPISVSWSEDGPNSCGRSGGQTEVSRRVTALSSQSEELKSTTRRPPG